MKWQDAFYRVKPIRGAGLIRGTTLFGTFL